MSEEYNDIIDMPYKKSDSRQHMSAHDRAAQFAPFSALTGYSDIVNETGRLTSRKVLLDDYQIELINRELRHAVDFIDERPVAEVKYFIPDNKKSGGEYRTVKDRIYKIDCYEKSLSFSSGERVPFENIIAIAVEGV